MLALLVEYIFLATLQESSYRFLQTSVGSLHVLLQPLSFDFWVLLQDVFLVLLLQADAKSTTSYFLGLTFLGIIKNILLNAPLLDLSWKTQKCRPQDLRGGAFSIHLPALLFSLNPHILIKKRKNGEKRYSLMLVHTPSLVEHPVTIVSKTFSTIFRVK